MMNVRRRFSVLLALVLVGAAVSHADETRQRRIDALFQKWDRPDSPGCALGVIEDGKFVYRRAYGMANLEHDIPLSTSSVFRMGSVSKQFAAFTILLAEQQGKLSLDDDVRKFIPELRPTEPPTTVRHLIHHTSGIRDYLTLMYLSGKRDEDFYTEDDVVAMLARQENTNFPPGSEYLYSNSGYFLLSQILLRATGLSLSAFANELIFEPLGMHDSHFHDDFRRIVKRRADGYRPTEDGGGFEIDMTTLNMVGDGGVYTTVDDLLAWDRNFETGEVGGEELRAKRLETDELSGGVRQTYAAGLVLSTYRGLHTVSHGGSFVGFRTAMLRFPDKRFSVYVLCNVSAARPTSLARRVADIYLADSLDPITRESATKLPPETLRSLAGTYWNDVTGELGTIELHEGSLRWKEWERRLIPLDDGSFLAVREGSRVPVAFMDEAEENFMDVRAEGQRPFRYQRVKPVSPGLRELALLIGLYRCSELDVTYRIELGDDDGLELVSPSFRSELEPVFADGFRWESGSLIVERDGHGSIRGFTLAAGRARGFFFEKL